MVCTACSQQMSPGARFCCHCGSPMPPPTAWNTRVPRLTRSRFTKMLGGVCGGIANAYGWDPALVRVGAVLLFFAGHICVVIAYIVAWAVIPIEPLYWSAPMTPGYPGGPAAAGGTPAGGMPVS